MRLGFLDPTGRVLTTDETGRVQFWDDAGRPDGPPLPVDVRGSAKNTYFDCLDFSPDGEWLTALVPGGGAQVFRAADRSVFGPVHFAGRAVLRVRLAPDHRTLAVCGEAIGAQLVDAETGATLWEIAPEKETVRLVEFSPDGMRLATCNQDRLNLWDVASRERLCATVKLGVGVIYECRFSPDGSAITVSMPGGALTLDAASGRPTGEKMPHTSHVTDFSSSADGRFIATGGYDGFARVWNARNGQPVTPWLPAGRGPCDAILSPDGSRLLTTCGQEMRLWEISSASPDRPRFPHPSAVRAIVSRDGRRLFTAGGKVVRLRDIASGADVWSAEFADDLADARLSADGRVVAAVTRDATLHLLEASSGKNLAPPRQLPFAPQHFAISPNAALLLAMNAAGESVLLARDPAVAPIAMPSLGAQAHGATFSRDGHFAAGTGFLGTCWIFDMQTRAITYRQNANPAQRATLIRFSADGRRAEWRDNAMSGIDGLRRGVKRRGVWDVEVTRDGTYEIALRRWPAASGLALRAAAPAWTPRDTATPDHPGFAEGIALPIASATLRIGKTTESITVAENDAAAVFRIALQAGRTELEGTFKDADGKPLGATYFATVKRVE